MLSMAGSIESCDCLVTIYKSNENELVLNTEMFAQYGKQIKTVVFELLESYNIKNIKVVIDDKGALDYTIKARLTTALQRGGVI